MNSIEKREASLLISLIAVLFVFDETLFPVFHIMGLPIKISYLLLLVWMIFHVFRIKVGNISFQFNKGSESKKVCVRLVGLIVLSVLGELTLNLYSDVADSGYFFDALVYYFFMMAAFGIGYTCYRFRTVILLYALYFYCFLNVGLLMFYDKLPSVFRTLYGEYFAQGVRIRGSGGNANATLLVMNCLLLAIVVLARNNKIKINGVHFWLVIMIPIFTNVAVSSRGEFVSTLILELLLIIFLSRNDSNVSRFVLKLGVLLLLLVGLYVFVFYYLYEHNANVTYGINRLSALGSVSDTDEMSDVDTVLRPFIYLDRFWARFIRSPIWGSGYSAAGTGVFFKSTSGYHNDWFRVLASTGILGFILWFSNERYFYKLAGCAILVPIFIAGLTNTFIQSVHAFNIYFFIMGVLCHYNEYEISNEESSLLASKLV